MLKIKLSEEERETLKLKLQAAKSQKALVYMDLKIIEYSDQGESVPEIGERLSLHPHTVRTVLKKFKAGGWAELQRKPRGKPEEKLKAYDLAYWEDILSQPPSGFEQLATADQNWTYVLIQTYVEKYLGFKVAISTIWSHLRKVGYTSGRAKLSITSPDPDYQVKRQRVEDLEKKVQKTA
jgi:transposase